MAAQTTTIEFRGFLAFLANPPLPSRLRQLWVKEVFFWLEMLQPLWKHAELIGFALLFYAISRLAMVW